MKSFGSYINLLLVFYFTAKLTSGLEIVVLKKQMNDCKYIRTHLY